MYEYLKTLFGDGAITFDQFCAALDANKGIKLVNLADGGYVSKEKFDAKAADLTTANRLLGEANNTIQSYKDMDIDGIKLAAANWESKYNTDTAALRNKLDEQAREFAAKMYLGGYQYTDDLVKEAIYAKFMAQNFTLGEDGKFEGADAFMEELKTAYPNSFAQPAGDPAPGDSSGAPPKPHPWFAPQMAPQPAGAKKRTLSEMMRYKNEHPEAKIDYD